MKEREGLMSNEAGDILYADKSQYPKKRDFYREMWLWDVIDGWPNHNGKMVYELDGGVTDTAYGYWCPAKDTCEMTNRGYFDEHFHDYDDYAPEDAEPIAFWRYTNGH